MAQENVCTYNVPLALVDSYPDRRLIVRASDPLDVVRTLSFAADENLVGLQLLGITADLEPLEVWNPGLPIEVVLKDSEAETMKLYRLSKLQRTHPVRVVIPLVPGFSKAARVASFLNLPVKLEGAQPPAELIEELAEALDFFLHNKAVSQPVDYFSGLLVALLHKVPVTLWQIQEEDPRMVRYVTDEGVEAVARRPFTAASEDLDTFQFELTKRTLSPESECASCEFFLNCGGYFKWPNFDFSCDGIKQIVGRVREAAYELHDDLSLYPVVGTEPGNNEESRL
ncbi:MAG TPA: hypothetical protein VFZ22_07255 [Pyrinomonadaceae bacterium]|nr:hypothetical protein [Pyrinomonadaceae bacterium]